MAYDKYAWGTSDYVTPTRMNHIENGIAGIKSQTLSDLAPTTNETWANFIFRNRTALISAYSFDRVLRLTVDGTANLYFHCTRRTSDSSMWLGTRYAQSSGTPTSVSFYYLSVSSSAGALRKITINSGGFSGTDLSGEVAEGNIAILGLNNNE